MGMGMCMGRAILPREKMWVCELLAGRGGETRCAVLSVNSLVYSSRCEDPNGCNKVRRCAAVEV